jgi:hypothetical protein
LVLLFLSLLAVVVFLYFMSTPLPEGQQGAKAEEHLQTKSSSHQSNSLGFYRTFVLALEESPLSHKQTQLSSSRVGR